VFTAEIYATTRKLGNFKFSATSFGRLAHIRSTGSPAV